MLVKEIKFKKRIIIGGLPRAGSTLLRCLLDSSKYIVCGHETYFFYKDAFRIKKTSR
ncbi:sulfotransferase [Anaerobacillus alkalilacustris]|uniref:sulfotransferase n=1 Tax=Anaerobacillus alkalilacustris TaxID=393763 RepID=UPI0011134705